MLEPSRLLLYVKANGKFRLSHGNILILGLLAVVDGLDIT